MPDSLNKVSVSRRGRAASTENLDFEVVETKLSDPGDGELLIRNAYVSVTRTCARRTSTTSSLVQPFRWGSRSTAGPWAR